MADSLHDVFISYARKDGAQYAGRLERDLQAAGYTTWRDNRDLDEYQDFSAEIEIGIRASRFVAVCVTPSIEQNPSSFVRREILYAQQKDKPIIPLVFPDADLPVLIVHLTWLAFFSGSKPKQSLAYDNGFNALLERIKHDQEPSSRRPSSDDPYREYLERLYESIVEYLSFAVFELIDVSALDTSEAVGKSKPKTMLMSFFQGAGIERKPDDKPLKNLKEGFDRYKGRLLLLGEPGAGKTTALMAFARDAVAARLADDTQPLPLMERIAYWDAQQQTPLVDWVAERLDLDQKGLQQEINAGNAMLLLDALDELGNERTEDKADPNTGEKIHERYDPRKRFMVQIPTTNRVIVSCRIKDYEAIGEKLALNGAVTLQKLTDTQIHEYLMELPDLWRALQNTPDLLEVARTPLLLSLFTFAFRDDAPEDLKGLGDLSQGELRDAIFKRYVEERYNHEARKPYADIPFTLEEVYRVLGHVAMLDASEMIIDESLADVVEIGTTRIWINFTRANIHYFVGERYQLFIELACRLHILVRANSDFNFIHLLLRDHFAFECSIANLKSSDDFLRRSAADALVTIRDKRAVEPICVMLNDADREVRLIAVHALTMIDDEQAVQPLVAALKDEDSSVRREATKALGSIGDGQAVQSLVAVLKDSDSSVRREAVSALEEIGDKQAVMPLIAVLNDEDRSVRRSAAAALGKLGDTRAIGPLIATLNDQTLNVGRTASDRRRGGIFATFSKSSPSKSPIRRERKSSSGRSPFGRTDLPPLGGNIRPSPPSPLERNEKLTSSELLSKTYRSMLGGFDSPWWEHQAVRATAAKALGELGAVKAILHLIAALKDVDSSVRYEAAKALERIGTEKALEAAARWREGKMSGEKPHRKRWWQFWRRK